MMQAQNKIKLARSRAGLTLDGLSQATGSTLSASRIANYESGLRTLKVDQAKILASALNVTPAYLLGLADSTDGTENLSDDQKQLLMVAQRISRASPDTVITATAILQALLQNLPRDN